jgi:hypothetical protein
VRHSNLHPRSSVPLIDSWAFPEELQRHQDEGCGVREMRLAAIAYQMHREV